MARKDRAPTPPRRVQAPKRREDPRRPRDPRRTRLWLAVAAGAFVVAAIAAGGFTLATRGDDAAAAAGCQRQTFPDQGRTHITPQQKPPRGFEFNSFPPTSGWHDPQPAIFNVYGEPVPQRHLLHSYEHGGIAVQYGRDVPSQALNQIVEWYQEDPNGIIVAPLGDSSEAAELRDRIVVTAWRRLMTCSSFDESAFSDFRDDYRAKGPEPHRLEDLAPGT